jgi:hypothetical protein
MEKMNSLYDYQCSCKIANARNLESDEYGKLYYKTNEDLIDAYLDTDFRNKDVFSVLGSSDQVLTARFLGAKKVDAFDINRLTYYYFYLRIWALKYYKELYPELYGTNSKSWLRNLLSKVKPENGNEKKALSFFKKHLTTNISLENLFFDDIIQPMGCTIYQKAEELEDCLSPELDFTCIDFFKPFETRKDYDIVLMSNILDLAFGENIKTTAENLARLVRSDGTVICSNLLYKTVVREREEERLFSPYFEREDKQHSYIYHKK